MKEITENKTFRILYFIGIFLVVANHLGGGSIDLLYNWFPAYSFHLPLFMFCSGYLIFKNIDDKPLIYIKKNIRKLLVPLYIWNIIYGLFVIFLHKKGFTFGESFNIFNIFVKPIYNGHQFIFTLATWFIFPLLILKIFNFFIMRTLKNNKTLYIPYFLLSILIGCLGVHLSMKGYNTGVYLLINKVLIFLPFFVLGMLYNRILERYDNLPNIYYFLILFVINLIIIYIFGGTREYVICWCNNFDNVYRIFIVGTIGILFWLRISRIITPILSKSNLVMKISRNTYDIVIHHIMGCFVLNYIYYLLSSFVFKDFDILQFRSNATYLYLPKGINNFLILYVSMGFGFPLIVIKIKELIRLKLKKRS